MRAENVGDLEEITHWGNTALPALPPRFVWVSYAREPAVVQSADEPWLLSYGWISAMYGGGSNQFLRVRLTVVDAKAHQETTTHYSFSTRKEAVQYLATACWMGEI